MSEVYFANLRADGKKSNIPSKVRTLFQRAGFPGIINERDFVAVKVHFGEKGNTGFIPPYLVRPVVDEVLQAGGKAFVTDSNTIYIGSRSDAVDHLNTAYDHGWLPSVVGAPVIIADGLRGWDQVKVNIDGRHFKEVNIGSAARHAEAIIGVTHVKCHLLAGIGGVIKNIGMGFASRSGKQKQHSDLKPVVSAEKCRACGECLRSCPAMAISWESEKASINHDSCIGCGECTATCRFGAIAVQWETDNTVFHEKMAEYCAGVLKDKLDKCGFISFITNVTPDCDCLPWSDAPIVPDIGLLASRDPVAIDQASADLINSAIGLAGSALTSPDVKDKLKDIHDTPWEAQIEHATRLGLGSREYDLIEI